MCSSSSSVVDAALFRYSQFVLTTKIHKQTYGRGNRVGVLELHFPVLGDLNGIGKRMKEYPVGVQPNCPGSLELTMSWVWHTTVMPGCPMKHALIMLRNKTCDSVACLDGVILTVAPYQRYLCVHGPPREKLAVDEVQCCDFHSSFR